MFRGTHLPMGAASNGIAEAGKKLDQIRRGIGFGMRIHRPHKFTGQAMEGRFRQGGGPGFMGGGEIVFVIVFPRAGGGRLW